MRTLKIIQIQIQIHLQSKIKIQIHLLLEIQTMQAMEEENTADNINGEVEKRVRSDSASSGNHDNAAFDEKVSQHSNEQDTFKDISSVLEG